MNASRHWQTALPTYLKIALKYFVIASAPPLAVMLVNSLLTAFISHHFAVNRVGVELALIFGGLFFLLALATAIAHDIHRNWSTREPTVVFRPELMWRTFIYLGAVFFLVAAFFAYHQGVWLSVFFVAFSIGSAITARCL